MTSIAGSLKRGIVAIEDIAFHKTEHIIDSDLIVSIEFVIEIEIEIETEVDMMPRRMDR